MKSESQQRCILYAEDDANDVFLLHHAFQEARIQEVLRVVNDGQAAIDYLGGSGPYGDRARYPFPMLVLLDLQLPLRNGLEVLQWIRSVISLRRLVVIMFTSSRHHSDITRAYDLGVNSFISKPVSVGDRVEFARELKGWWLTRNQAPAILPEVEFTSARETIHKSNSG
jgi:CheY-like chemotaxis protein